ncbi:MAG: DUF3800 domain-containing protein [Pseudomonadota bacterium]
MSRIAFADESGIGGKPKCYAIGIVSVAQRKLAGFNHVFERLTKQHGVSSEVKWENVRNGHGLINLGIDWLHRILKSNTARFDVIVVNTEQYRKWSERGADRETAFYLTYTYLLRHLARQVRETTEVLIDDRSDEYPKQHEVVETIANRMLDQLHSTGRLDKVTKVPSHQYPGVQVADLMTGAINAGHRLFLDPDAPLNPGKRLAISRMASLLGWDALHYDTFPHNKFNIWHFPKTYRAVPASRQIRVPRLTPFITPVDLRVVRDARGAVG